MKKQLLSVLASGFIALAANANVKGVQATSPMDNYTPTVVDSSDIANIWNNMRKAKRDSVCQDRAHVWSYEMKKNHNIDSMKIIVHYTLQFKEVADYLNDFIWHYHIAPMVETESGEKVVLDKMIFPNGPVTDEQWVSHYEQTIEKVLNNDRLMAKIQAKIDKAYDTKSRMSSKDRTLYKQIDNLITNTNTVNGRYDIQCAKIENIIEHDIQRNGQAWCHYQDISMYYLNQQDLRLLNFNDHRIGNYKLYDQTGADYGSQFYQRYEFGKVEMTGRWIFKTEKYNSYVDDAYKSAFGIKVKDEDIKPFPHH